MSGSFSLYSVHYTPINHPHLSRQLLAPSVQLRSEPSLRQVSGSVCQPATINHRYIHTVFQVIFILDLTKYIYRHDQMLVCRNWLTISNFLARKNCFVLGNFVFLLPETDPETSAVSGKIKHFLLSFLFTGSLVI